MLSVMLTFGMGIGLTRKQGESAFLISINAICFGTLSGSINDVIQDEPGCIVENC